MQNKKKKKIILIIVFTILLIGIGFAILSSDLNIKGNFQLSKITWDVHFENFNEMEDNTVNSTSHEISSDGTTLTYSIKIDDLKDRYSFTIDVVNDGTLDAMIKGLEESGLTEAQKKLISYSVTYSDLTKVKEKDLLPAGKTETLIVTIEIKKDIENSDLEQTDSTLSLQLKPKYVQDDGTGKARPDSLLTKLKTGAVLDNTLSTYVTGENGIDFTQISSDTNGKGLYIRAGTESDTNPIYYFRGAVDNNNVKFANYCWKIVRTTDTGGIKMIFNGTPSEDGKCNNTGAASQVGTSRFNIGGSIAYSGYMFGKVVPYEKISTNIMCGYEATYSEGTYTLTYPESSYNTNRQYCCENNSTTCSTVKYIYFTSGAPTMWISLSEGRTLEETISPALTNEKDSIIKDYIENTWYANNMTDYSKYLEDTVYCNNREVSDYNWIHSGICYNNPLNTSLKKDPIFDCVRPEDKFTVSTTIGNGKLKYKTGLLTIDEVDLAGGAYNVQNTSYYLYTGQNYFTMTPGQSVIAFNGDTFVGIVTNTGAASIIIGSAPTIGVRPVISLKPFIAATSGNGTADSPYVIE